MDAAHGCRSHTNGVDAAVSGVTLSKQWQETDVSAATMTAVEIGVRRLCNKSEAIGLERRFINFNTKAQTANNHCLDNAGGVALALKLYPNAPQAKEALAWLDCLWKHLASFGDWKEWNYYPHGPIFLHGVLDIAEATGWISSDRELIKLVGQRCLSFIHGGNVRGNPNSGVRMRMSYEQVYVRQGRLWDLGDDSCHSRHFVR
ncbi:MAG: hypothetical protein GWQ05_12470 [Verrucomicrobiaceae bacterium]|nr:hypothetical protein [Verrucomicrobiaceae bacterium]NCF91752.1 hypothetical protein [Verrucomicrobiaceae bacterium]